MPTIPCSAISAMRNKVPAEQAADVVEKWQTLGFSFDTSCL